MRFFDCKGFPNPDRIRIALAEKGLLDDVTIIQVDVSGGEHRSTDFLMRNPSATVPVLELDDGTSIAECTAITEYLDTFRPPCTLTGSTPKQKGVIHMAQRQIERGLLDAIGSYFHYATPGLGPALESHQNHDWGHHCLDTAIRTASSLNDRLGRMPYVAGEEFSMADITGFAGFSFAEIANVELRAGHDHIERWLERLMARPSFGTVGN
jgi:glutathione S-transferase